MLSFVSASGLSDYPAPFFEDGVLDALMISGEDASPADLIGLIDLAHSMQYSAVVKETIDVASDTPFVTGDSVKAWREGDLLELNELLGEVTETYDASDALALDSYTVSTDKGSTKVNQYLRFSWGDSASDKSAAKVVYTENNDEEIGDFLWFEDGGNAFQYELEFESGLKSEVSSGGLPDLEGRNLHILGDDFSIVEAEYSSSEGVALTLMGGAVEDVLGEGETRTYEVDGKEYEVTLVIVSDWPGVTGDAKLKFKVNGVLTKELTAGGTTTLLDGTVLGVKEVLPNEAGETTGGDIVAFYLGAYKVELSDVYSAGSWDGNVEVDGDRIDDASLMISYDEIDDNVAIRKISYRLVTDAANDGYIPPGAGVRSVLREPEGMLGVSWDIRYEGLSAPGYSGIDVVSSGDDEYRLKFENTQGIEYTVRLAYANSTGLCYGDDDRALVFRQGNGTDVGNFTIHPSDYFIVSHNGGTNKGVTRVMQFDSFDTSEGIIML
ncbi:hypothetical protein KY363_03510, partial [Candidatus Woesearchaeota archaeon]|nr:hypothetical protein [Candidatus Woesearchaeota archaeon]